MKKTFPEAIRISWEEVEELLWQIFVSMRKSGYSPDVVIGVARGGLAPARILADYLQNKYVCTFQMGHWGEGRDLSDRPSIVFPLPEVDLSKEKVLVVDDVTDEGGTMGEVVNYLKDKVGDIRTAVLIDKDVSKFRPDFYGRAMKEWKWVLFPWSRHEDLLAFTEKVLQLTGGVTIEDIVRILEEALSVEIVTAEIEKVLFDMKLAGEVTEGKDKVWSLI
ncbi:MAG TPA: phosphoribosyltransferase [Deltaproteobacteria bacterium]|nr:phosphoribosyltransferase [Deltaproteobacteria bacterium]HOI07481.1 phosphoribosyltransferase [Deltaproteobacteria bacterium]